MLNKLNKLKIHNLIKILNQNKNNKNKNKYKLKLYNKKNNKK